MPVLSLLYLAVTPWVPLAVLTGTALLLLPLRVRHIPHVVQGGVLLATAIVWGWTLVMGLSPIPMVHEVSLSGPLGLSLTLLLRLDQGHWFFAFVAATLALGGAFLLPRRPPVGRVSGPSAALVLLAGVLVTTMAGNLLTLWLGWLLTHIAYLGLLLSGGSRALWRTVGLVLLAGIVLWGIISILPPSMSLRPWSRVTFPTWALAAMGVSVWLFLGAYPLHRQHLVAVPGVPAPWPWLDVVAGGAWLWRWATLEGASLIWSHPTWLALALFAVFGSALAAWISPSPRSRLVWATIQRNGLLLFLPILGMATFHAQVILLITAVVLAGSSLLVLQRRPLGRGNDIAYLLALAIFEGIPWTAGAPLRDVIAHLWSTHPLLGGLLVVADALVLSALLFPGNVGHDGGFLQGLRLAFFLLPALWIGWTLRRATGLSPLGWAETLLPPLLLGGFLAWQRPRIFVELRNWAWGMRAVAYLRPMEGFVGRLASWSLTGLGGIVALVDGAAWIGWLLLAAILAVVWPYLPGGR